MAAWRRAIELSLTDMDFGTVEIDNAVANGTGGPGRAGANSAGILEGPVFLRGEPSPRIAPPDSPALRRTSCGRRCDGGAGRSPSSRQRAGDHDGSQGLVDGLGMPQGQGVRLSARTVDDAASGPPRPRAWAGGGARLPCHIGAGHGVQDPRSRRGEAAQGALLPGAPRPAFAEKMAEVLCVYRKVRLLKKDALANKTPGEAVAVISYDEKPGIQAIATTAPDLPPTPGVHPTFARDHEYKRHGTVTLLAGIDLVTGKVHALVKDRHRSRAFIDFLKLLDAAYPADTAIHLILDNHSAHISRETQVWLAEQPADRFRFTFTPKHGSWLNLIEGFFSKLAGSVLRHIRVSSKQELKDRLMAAIDYFNQDPVVHTWTYRIDKAA